MWSLPSRSRTILALAALFLLSQSAPASGATPQTGANPTAPLIDTPPGVNLLINGDFSNGMASWLTFATPDLDHIQARIVNDVFEFYRVPQHDGRANQAVVFQWTNAPLVARAPVVATFDLGNSTSVRKRISVLIHEDEFSDLHVCSFWLAPNAPMRTYAMQSHTTKAWHNATIAFYAASAGSDGGFYQIDNVSLMYDPAGDGSRTVCEDPAAPAPPGGPDGPTLLLNGDFTNGLAPWAALHRLVWQLVGGVFEFVWLVDAPPDVDCHPIPQFEPAPVVIQRTGAAVMAGEILTANVDLGNSSPVRKRVSVLIHQFDFADLATCSFWLEPGAPLQTYTVRMYATLDWSDAALSVYAATRGPDEWIQLDNAVLRRTPGTPTAGTECYGPVIPTPAPDPAMHAAGGGVRGDIRRQATAGFRVPGEPGWRFVDDGRLQFMLPPSAHVRAIEVSADGDIWQTVLVVEPSEDWRAVTIVLDEIAEPVRYLRVRRAG
jgi:hypothetical protein